MLKLSSDPNAPLQKKNQSYKIMINNKYDEVAIKETDNTNKELDVQNNDDDNNSTNNEDDKGNIDETNNPTNNPGYNSSSCDFLKTKIMSPFYNNTNDCAICGNMYLLQQFPQIQLYMIAQRVVLRYILE